MQINMIGYGWNILYLEAGLHESLQPCSRAARKMEREWGNEEEMEKKWGNGERLTLYISSFSLYFLPLSPFPPSLSISYIKMHHILLQNVKYGTFVANVTKISTYALWGNNSGSNLLRGSSAIRAGLVKSQQIFAHIAWKRLISEESSNVKDKGWQTHSQSVSRKFLYFLPQHSAVLQTGLIKDFNSQPTLLMSDIFLPSPVCQVARLT